MTNKKSSLINSPLFLFASKFTIGLILLSIFIDFIISDISGQLMVQKEVLKRELSESTLKIRNEKTKLYMLSFVQNPRVLYLTSEISEKEGSIEGAIRDMEVAIGLLELHNADKNIMKKYHDRLAKLGELKITK